MNSVKTPLIVFNAIGAFLAIAGILGMLITGKHLLVWLIVSLMGSILFGGPPRMRDLRRVIKLSPLSVMLAIAISVFYVKSFGADEAWQSLAYVLFATLFLESFFMIRFSKLVGI